MPEQHQNLFTGRSGHLAVMAEFLHRGINVAIPEVDIGDDVFVVRGMDEAVTRVQVKSANGAGQQNQSYVAQFNIPLDQLRTPDTPALVYVLAVRYLNRWSDFFVIRRSTLNSLNTDQGAGTVTGVDGNRQLHLRLVLTTEDVQTQGVSFQGYRNAFDPWPPQVQENQ